MGSIFPPSVPIPAPTTLLSINTGKLKPLGPLSITSAIVKLPRPGRLHVTKLGLPDDEHDLVFHGGVDKALHQYCSDHYPLWRALYPDTDVAARFQPGGFGENFIAAGWSEESICVGDVVRVGGSKATLDDKVISVDDDDDDAVLLEVSLPRQPCFKLNQRFGIKNFAGRTHALNRTGWYYRVLREGWIETGMAMEVVERRHGQWTIAQLHQHVHRDKHNREAMQELVQIEQMGMECKGVFERRLKTMKEAEMGIAVDEKKEVWRDFRIAGMRNETERIVAVDLKAVEGEDGARDINPGSHVRLKLPVSEEQELIRPYSVVSGTTSRFTLGIAREELSRGGSKYIHDVAKLDEVISVGKITESVPIDESASHHILIAGGIGITAFLAAVKVFEKIHYPYDLHYAVRSSREVAFRELILPLGSRVRIYDKSKGERMDVTQIIKDRKWNSHVYVCGPERMMDSVLKMARECGMSSDEVHYEAFQGKTSGDPFTAGILGQDETLKVGENETLLEVLRKAGMDIQSSCEVGNCGTCRITICKGNVEHRGSALSEDEKSKEMLSCVSRGIGHIVVEIET